MTAMLARDDLDITVEDEARTCRRPVLVLLEMAAARLYSAGNSRSSMMAAQDTGMAADCLHAAGRLAPEPHKYALLRLSAALNDGLREVCGPPLAAIDATAAALDPIIDAINETETDELRNEYASVLRMDD